MPSPAGRAVQRYIFRIQFLKPRYVPELYFVLEGFCGFVALSRVSIITLIVRLKVPRGTTVVVVVVVVVVFVMVVVILVARGFSYYSRATAAAVAVAVAVLLVVVVAVVAATLATASPAAVPGEVASRNQYVQLRRPCRQCSFARYWQPPRSFIVHHYLSSALPDCFSGSRQPQLLLFWLLLLLFLLHIKLRLLLLLEIL